MIEQVCFLHTSDERGLVPSACTLVIFLRVELSVTQYFSDMREKAETRRVTPEVNPAKPDVEKLTAIDEWKAVLQRILACSNRAKAMIAVGVLVNIILAVTESAWFAYYS